MALSRNYRMRGVMHWLCTLTTWAHITLDAPSSVSYWISQCDMRLYRVQFLHLDQLLLMLLLHSCISAMLQWVQPASGWLGATQPEAVHCRS